MTYTITGLDPAPFAPLFDADEARLAARGARRLRATDSTGFPCRVSLEDAAEGEPLLLVNHVSNDVAGPFRTAHAIYVREGAKRAPPIHDRLPPMLDRRVIGLRAFAADGMLRRAVLAGQGEADGAIRALLSDEAIAYIHAHNAAYGCFLAGVERDA